MQIKELAGKLKISPRAVRFYEDKGLLRPAKQERSGYREFGEQDVWRLQTIISLREAGMTVADIKRVLDHMDDADTSELQYYLELQRSVLFAKWLELKQIIETTDDMIQMVKSNQGLPLDEIYRLAEGSRRLREQRNSWSDKWDYDRLAVSHDQRVQTDTENYKDYDTALELIAGRIASRQGEKGLDVGTGTGNLAGKLILSGASMSAVDQSREMLNICRSKFPELETKLGNFLALPFMDGTFDFAVSSFALHHLTSEQIPLAIRELKRVLKPQGRVCLADLMAVDGEPEVPKNPKAGNEYPVISRVIGYFEENGFEVSTRQVNERLYVVYASAGRG